MSCKYNNSMYTIEPEEVDVCFDEFEQLLLSEDYESQEELNHRLNEEYFQVYEGMKREVKYKVLEAQL